MLPSPESVWNCLKVLTGLLLPMLHVLLLDDPVQAAHTPAPAAHLALQQGVRTLEAFYLLPVLRPAVHPQLVHDDPLQVQEVPHLAIDDEAPHSAAVHEVLPLHLVAYAVLQAAGLQPVVHSALLHYFMIQHE